MLFNIFNREKGSKDSALNSLRASEIVFGKCISDIESKSNKTASDEIAIQNCIRYIERDRLMYEMCTGIEKYDCIIRKLINCDEMTNIKSHFGDNIDELHKSLKLFADKSYKYRKILELEKDIKIYTDIQEIVVNNQEEFDYLSKDMVMAKCHDDIVYKDKIRTNVINELESLISSEYSTNKGVMVLEQAYCLYTKKYLPKEIRVRRVLIDCNNSQNSIMKYYSFSNKYIEKYEHKQSISGSNNISEAKVERDKLTAGLRYDILKRDNFRCKICGRTAEDGVKLHVDHIKPISKGGKTVPENLRVLCSDCNLGKSDKYEPLCESIDTIINQSEVVKENEELDF